MKTQIERRVAPPEFQSEICRRFGLNRFDEPNFKLAWGQTEMCTVAGMSGYEQRPISGLPCWVVFRWMAPELYGTPEAWYAQNFDELTGLCLLGPFPDKGRYEPCMPLMRREMVNGKLKIDALPLSWAILDTVIPLMIQAQRISWLERKLASDREQEIENENMVQQIADRLDNARQILAPNSYAGKLHRGDSLLQRKMDSIERSWKQLPQQMRHGKGVRIVN